MLYSCCQLVIFLAFHFYVQGVEVEASSSAQHGHWKTSNSFQLHFHHFIISSISDVSTNASSENARGKLLESEAGILENISQHEVMRAVGTSLPPHGVCMRLSAHGAVEGRPGEQRFFGSD